MKQGYSVKLVTLLMVCAVPLVGCETAGQSAALGGLVGAGAGAAIGNQSGHAAEGALIGAAVGGLAGFAIGKAIQQERLATKAELEQEYAEQGKAVPTEPTIAIDSVTLADQEINAGEKTSVTTQYTAFNMSEPPKATMRLLRGGNELYAGPMTLKNDEISERTQFSANDVSVPKGQEPGDYTVEITLQNGDAVDTEQCTLKVV